jgi:glycosyltransferase involved in cell wall biosynthesis
VDEDKVVVVPNAASARFSPMNREHAFERAAARFSIGGPFLLAVGDLQPRKNQLGLVRAFEALLERHPGLPHWLVLAGKDTWRGAEVHRAAECSRAARRIRFTGYVSDEELRLLYNACQVFVFPSFYEGFGIPILEAMACGCAVACSDATAMPEVADSAAIFFDPRSTSAMRRALEDLTLDPGLRARMERLGLQRAALFSWEEAARRTLEVYYSVAGERRVVERERARAATAVRP